MNGFEKPTVAVDFDGTLTTGVTPYTTAMEIPDPPVRGATAFLYRLAELAHVAVYSNRAQSEEGRVAIVDGLTRHGFVGVPVTVTNEKPVAVSYLDDHAWPRWDGVFPDPRVLLEAPTWNEDDRGDLPPQLPPLTPGDFAALVAGEAARVEPFLTVHVSQAVLGQGGALAGFQHRLKTERHIAGKIDALEEQKQLTAEQAAADVKDAVRYTAVFAADGYTRAVRTTLARLDRVGLSVARLRNYWPADADVSGRDTAGTYVGVHAVVVTLDGYRFELQFHTPESLLDQALNWDAYRQVRKGGLDALTRREMLDRMRVSAGQVPVPAGALKLTERSLTAAAAPERPPVASHMNRVLRAAEKRAGDLEAQLVAVLVPILDRAADVAARNFEALAVHHGAEQGMTAAADRGFCLPAELRTKTDPVRLAFIENVGRASVEGVGVAWDVTNPFVQHVIGRAGKQVTHIAKTTQRDVMRAVKASYDQGLSVSDTAKAIRTVMRASSQTRATLIARTELAGASNGASLASMRAVNDALGGGDAGAPSGAYDKVWLTAPGATFPRHELVDGLDEQAQALEAPFDVDGEPLMYPGDPDGSPENVCNCFPAETLVEMPGLRASMRRWYEGDLVRVRFASGDVLAATPNHPVLRADGQWVPLCEVNEGDNLVSARLAWDDAGAPDPERPPTEIGEVHRLASVAGDPERVRLRPPDFHGDGADGEVEVVALDGQLLLDVEAASEEEVAELGLALAAAARTCQGGSNETVAMRDWFGRHWACSAARGVGGVSERAAVFVAQPLHSQPVGVGAVSRRQAELAEAPDNGGAAGADLFADSEDAFAALVTLAQVVEVEREPFHGYVYNLDTGGWYTAGTIACRNCRCTMVYEDASGQETGDAQESLDASGRLACGAHMDVLEMADVEWEVRCLHESLTAAGGAGWRAPAPDEILNVSCDAHVVAETAGREAAAQGHDVTLLPEWARRPVAELSPSEAQAELARLKAYRTNRMYRRLPGVTEEQRLARLDAAGARLKELEVRAEGRVPPPVKPPVEPAPVAPPPERPFGHYADATVNTQIARSRSALKKLLAKEAGGDTLTLEERAEQARHEERLRQLLAEREYRKTGEGAVVRKPAANERMQALHDAYARRGPVPSDTARESVAWEQRTRELGAKVAAEVASRSVSGTAGVLERRVKLLDVLSEVRKMGPAGKEAFSYAAGNQAELSRLVDRASSWYPRDWIQQMGRRRLTLETTNRGYFAAYRGRGGGHKIALSMFDRSKVLSDPRGLAVAVHELGHLMEAEVPGLKRAEAAFYERRTAGEAVRRYRFGNAANPEWVRGDEFVDEYIGKDYSHLGVDLKPGEVADTAGEWPDGLNYFEVLSIGMEALFTGSYDVWRRDPDMRDFILGLLVSV